MLDSGKEQIPVSIVGGSNFGIHTKVNAEKTFNMFVSDKWFLDFPGFKVVTNIRRNATGGPNASSLGAGRGLFLSTRGGFVLSVVNSEVYRIDANLKPRLVGSIDTGAGEVFMDENLSKQICLVDGVNVYIISYVGSATTLTKQVVTADLIPSYVEYHNSFFLIANAKSTVDSTKWYVFQFLAATTIAQVTAANGGEHTLQTKPDYPIAIKRIPGQSDNILVLGTTVCEIYQHVGGLQNYRRVSSLSIDYGCQNVSTIASSDKYIAWLATNEDNAPVIMVYGEGGTTVISTDGIEHLLSRLKNPEKSTAYFTRQGGHLFYCLTFFGEENSFTIAYDFNSKMFFNLSDADLSYHPMRQLVFFDSKVDIGKTYFVSLKNTLLYELDFDATTYDENRPDEVRDEAKVHEIPRLRFTNSIRKANSGRYIADSFVMTIDQGNDPITSQSDIDNACNDFIIDEDEIDIITEQGQSTVTEDSTECIVYRQAVDCAISKNGGATYSSFVRRELNPIGKRKNILRWSRMGQANDLTIQLRFWGKHHFVVNDGYVEIT